MRVLIITFFMVLAVGYGIHFFDKERKIKRLLTSTDKLPMKVVVGFSVNELIDRLKAYYSSDSKKIFIEYADDKYLEINTNDTKEYILGRIDEIQEFMIRKRYEPDEEYVVKEYLSRVMHDLWLDYSYRNNYKTIFWREIGGKYSEGEISTSSYNQIYKRFYSYKFQDS